MSIEDKIRKHTIKHTPDYQKMWRQIEEKQKVSTNRIFHFPKRLIVAPLFVILIVLGIGSHPILAQKLQELPYIGSVFNYLGDEGIKKALDQGNLILAEDIDLKSDDLVDQPEILSAVMDGSKLYVSFIIAKSDYELLNNEEFTINLNNNEIELLEFRYDQSYENSQNYIVYMTGKLPLNHNSDHENFVTVDYQGENYIRQPYKMIEVDSDIYEIAIRDAFDSLGDVYFDYVIVSPLAVELRFRLRSDLKINEGNLKFEVFDAQGHSLNPLFDSLSPTIDLFNEGLYQYHYSLRYTPSDHTEYLKIIPILNTSPLNELLLDLDDKHIL